MSSVQEPIIMSIKEETFAAAKVSSFIMFISKKMYRKIMFISKKCIEKAHYFSP